MSRGTTATRPRGHLTLDELRDKCLEVGLTMPPKPTRGLLMRMLRENTPPDDTEKVNFGAYKGYMYKEVNEECLQWAMREIEANPQQSPDLARLVRWAQARQTRPATVGAASGSGDPEQCPSLPVPPSALPKAKVSYELTGNAIPTKVFESSSTCSLKTSTADCCAAAQLCKNP